ncbi:MAG: YabP/YqfC family sporulation protein [Lachnospiraceae bacterium]|nr:YabP/YqfC family sporulation protein [Lachnospiraceae bacterium]
MKISSNHKKHKRELNPLYSYINSSEKKRQKEYESFIEHSSGCMSIPKDVLANQAMISLIGNHGIRVTNYRAIEEYSTENIKLSLGKKHLLINGSHLFIEYFRKDEIKIVGNILNVSFIL